ncbi:amidohydrolase [Oligoflexus tunisiensis]|uniref:amidohydrolase n=1 Tax=Oligoflexus tunisiensis TaxID=708132 RepID=UPI000A5837A6|nr:amidohydrolase [Oligoflexus tunisiensis]
MKVHNPWFSLVLLAAPILQAKPLEQDYPYLEKLYKELHQNPELSLQEKATAQRMAQELKSLGFAVTENVGGFGVVGVFKNGQGPTVLIRTDTDALPVKEESGKAYASRKTMKDREGTVQPVMHACGHDIHMTVFSGTARQLIDQKSKWHGTLVMIAQPAEETGMGARAMLQDGLFKKFPRPDYNLALHVSAELPAGELGFTSGYALANVDSVDIKVRGEGGHGAYPHMTKDPIVLAAQLINSLQTVVSREIAPVEPAVVTVGSIHGGSKHNIIADEVNLQLTLRSYSPQVREQTIAAIKRIARGLAITAGLPEEKFPVVTVQDEFTPSVYNNPELTQRIVAVAKNIVGEAHVKDMPPTMGGEDFGQYGRVDPKIPSLIYWLGSVDPETHKKTLAAGKKLPSLHSAQFAPLPEPTIKTGVKMMTAAALELFDGHETAQRN